LENHIPPTLHFPESQQKDPIAYPHPAVLFRPTASGSENSSSELSLVFIDLLDESEPHPPRSGFRAPLLLNGRERIRVRAIHQMNYFDDEVCLPGMSVRARVFRACPHGVPVS
jgi:hypothetical protein